MYCSIKYDFDSDVRLPRESTRVPVQAEWVDLKGTDGERSMAAAMSIRSGDYTWFTNKYKFVCIKKSLLAKSGR